MDQFLIDAADELVEALGREPTYEEVMEYMDAKDDGMGECFLERMNSKEEKWKKILD